MTSQGELDEAACTISMAGGYPGETTVKRGTSKMTFTDLFEAELSRGELYAQKAFPKKQQ